MTDHDRLRERLRALDSVQPSPGLMDRARSAELQRQPAGPSRGRRFVVIVTAFAVFGASAFLVWRAFDPMGKRDDAVATRNPVGEQPPDWVVQKAIEMAASNEDPTPTAAFWILADSITINRATDPGSAGATLQQTPPPQSVPQYLVVLYGSFRAVNAHIPPGAAVPTGTVITFTLDPENHGVNDFGIDSRPIHLEGLQRFSLLPGETSVYVDQVGLPISMDYPSRWFVRSIGQVGDPNGPRQRGVVISNARAAMPPLDSASQGPIRPPELPALPPDFVRVTILTNGEKRPPVHSDVNSPLPLSMSDAQFGGPGNVRALSATVAGVRLTFYVQAGSTASAADLAAADRIVASVVPTDTNSGPERTTATQPPGWVVQKSIEMAIANGDKNPASAAWVLADRDKVAPYVGLDGIQGSKGDEYLVALRGSFTANGAKVPRGAPIPTGPALVFTLDPKTHQVLDWTVGDLNVDLPGMRSFVLRPTPPTASSQQQMCYIQQSASLGDVNGDGSADSVAIGSLRSPKGACPDRTDGGTRVLTVDLGNDGSGDARSTAMNCTTSCVPFAVTDIGGDGRAEILVWEDHLAPPASAVVAVYELRSGKLLPVTFPGGSNRFDLVQSWQGPAGASCSDSHTFTTWSGRTDDGGSLRAVTSWTYRIDVPSLTFTLVSKQGPSPATKVPARTGWRNLCGAAVSFG